MINATGFTPHSGQRRILNEIANANAKYNTVVTSRQFGKSTMALNLVLFYALNTKNTKSLFTSKVHAQANSAFKKLVREVEFSPVIKEINNSTRSIDFTNGSSVRFSGIEKADNLRGEDMDYLFCDEFAYARPGTWDYVLMPMLTVRGRKVFFFSTPKGTKSNEFYRYYMLGKSEDPMFFSTVATWEENPLAQTDIIEAARKSLPEAAFQQEFQCKFLDGEGTVFTNVAKCATLSKIKEPVSGGRYYAGVDFGKSNDYTVCIIVDEGGSVVAYYRDTGKSWSVMLENVAKLLRKYNAYAFAEENSIGSMPVEMLKKHWPKTYGKFTNSNKTALIEGLMIAFQNLEIQIPTEQLWAPLFDELISFEATINKNFNVTYAAPPGLHDDTVMALAYAWYCRSQYKSSGVKLHIV